MILPFFLAVAARAMEFPYWPDPDFISQTLEAFPEKAIATPDEARVLISEGKYNYVDVRPKQELEDAGKYSKAINVPLYNAQWKYDPEAKKKKFIKEENSQFLDMFKRKFPDLDTPIVIVDRDGKTYALEALEMLDEAGYTNLVALRGGWYGWFRVYDNNLRRRRGDGFVEAYDGDGSDSCGIHGTGAGFDRVDKVEGWQPPAYDD